MGTVYRAEHQRLKRPVAIKVLAQHLAADPTAVTRFQREAEIVSQLHHPHVVHILDFDTTDNGDPYIVMELLSGEALSRRLDRERILALRDAIQIVAQTAGGLVVAHAAGIVHRDLKPDNVFLLDMQDSSVFVKLLDFGISKRAATTSRVTGEFDVLGTPDYMAPEQVIDSAHADHRADQWSLAAITYEMLCGRIPFFGETAVKTLAKVVGEPPTPLVELAPGIPKELAAIVERGLAKDPAARFASVMEFADRLAEIAGLSSGPSPAAWIGAHEYVTADQRSASVATPSQRSPISHAPGQHTRPPRASATAESESRLPIPTAPDPNPSPDDEISSIGGPNRRLRQSERPADAILTQNARRPQRTRPRGLLQNDENTRMSIGSARPTPEPASGALVRLQAAMDEVRQAVTFGEDQRALAKARVVLQLAQAGRSREAKDMLSSAAELLGPIFLRSLGGLKRKVSLSEPQTSRTSSFSPEHVFLLSRIEGTSTVEELLDVSPLSMPETLGILLDFRDEGYLGFD
jgi:serine/threonine protein kinase